jgi:hypothetical protein
LITYSVTTSRSNAAKRYASFVESLPSDGSPYTTKVGDLISVPTVDKPLVFAGFPTYARNRISLVPAGGGHPIHIELKNEWGHLYGTFSLAADFGILARINVLSIQDENGVGTMTYTIEPLDTKGS